MPIAELQLALNILDVADAADTPEERELGRRDARLLLKSVESVLETVQPGPEEWRRIDLLTMVLRGRLSAGH